MSGVSGNPCPFEEMVVPYSHRDLSARQMLRFEKHLPDCPECSARVFDLRRVHSLFGEAALLHRLAPLAVKVPIGEVAAAMAAAGNDAAAPDWAGVQEALEVCVRRESSPPNLRHGRLEAWRATLKQTPAEALERMSSLTRSSAESVFVALSSVWKVGAAFFQDLQFTTGVPAFRAATKDVEVQTGPPRVEVKVHLTSNGVLCVVVFGLPEGTEPPAIMVAPRGRPQEALVKPLENQRGRWLARFDGMKENDYAVALEPLRALLARARPERLWATESTASTPGFADAVEEAADLVRQIHVVPGQPEVRRGNLASVLAYAYRDGASNGVGVSCHSLISKVNWEGIPVIVEPADNPEWCEFLFLASDGSGEIRDLPSGDYRLALSWEDFAQALQRHLEKSPGEHSDLNRALSAFGAGEFEVKGTVLALDVDWSRESGRSVHVRASVEENAPLRVLPGTEAGDVEVWCSRQPDAGTPLVLMLPTRPGGTWGGVALQAGGAQFARNQDMLRLQKVTNGTYKLLIIHMTPRNAPEL